MGAILHETYVLYLLKFGEKKIKSPLKRYLNSQLFSMKWIH